MCQNGWNKMLSTDEFTRKVCYEYPDWEKVVGNQPVFVMMEIIVGKDMSSIDIARKFDDESQGQFHYRDFTKSTLPFVNDGDTYWSTFSFQYLSDAENFVSKFNGKGNWMPDYKEFNELCNKKRCS